MALTIPDVIPTKASTGEQTVFYILKNQLPDDYYIYYEPNIAGAYPDFVVIGPDLGILILELKGWQSNSILEADHYSFKIQSEEKISSLSCPLRQVKRYFEKLTNLLTEYSILTQPEDSEHFGKLSFPIGQGVIMTSIKKADAMERGIDKVLPNGQVVYKDELNNWPKMTEQELYERLCQMFMVRFPFTPLVNDQINTIRGIIHPEIKIKTQLAKLTSVPEGVKLQDNAEIIKTLDIQQEQIATTMGEGHRLFYGVAGSGKTLILLARAKILANQIDTNKILILCFNKVLTAYLRSLINQVDNPVYQEKISVQHFHGWAKSVIGSLPNRSCYPENESGNRQYDEDVSHALQRKIDTLTLAEKWDAILIDEAHTFESSWFNCCVNALKDPDNSNLMIVADGTQSLYQRKKFTWKSVGVKAVGRSRKLTQNYRNTQEIVSAAWAVVSSDVENDQEIENLDATFPLVKPQDCLRKGKVPILKTMKSSQQQNEILIGDIQKCLANYQPHELAIIYRCLREKESNNFHDLKNQLTDLNIPFYNISQNKSDFNIQEPGIRIVTAKSSLGLEFKVVFIIWVQTFGINEAESKTELYVAMTRAQEELYLYGSGGFDFMKSLASNPYLQVIQK